jgi:hypothetical protein
MSAYPTAGPERLTDGSTFYWSRVFPTLWCALVGVVVALFWADVVSGPGITTGVKTLVTAIWAVLSAGFYLDFGRLQEVWLHGDELLFGDPHRGTRVSLRDVRRVKESRLRHVKQITLELARPTSLGTSVTFVPKGVRAFLFPYASSPVAEELRERRERLLPPG